MPIKTISIPRPATVTGWTPSIFEPCEHDLPGREGEPPAPLHECRLCQRIFVGSWQDNPAGFAHECKDIDMPSVKVNNLAP